MAHPASIVDAGAAALAVGALVNVLPPIAAVMAITWYAIQIWQSDTGKMWRSRWRRLFFRKTTADDRMAFLVLALGGVGAMLAILALGMVMQ